MREDITVITPCDVLRSDYLLDAIESVQRQDARHIIVFDGEVEPSRKEELEQLKDDRVSPIILNSKVGVSACRNIALAMTPTPYFRNLDADDILLDGALDEDMSHLNDGYSFTTSCAYDLYEDGRIVHFPALREEGEVPENTISVNWSGEVDIPDIHPTTFAGAVDDVIGIGGYPAVPRCEDVIMVSAVNRCNSGYFSHKETVAYRKWSNQTTKRNDDVLTMCRAFRNRILDIHNGKHGSRT